MDGIHLSLSDRQAAFVDEQVASGGFASASEFVGALIDAEAKAKARERLEELLMEGLQGPMTKWTEADGEALLQLAHSRVEQSGG